MFTPELSVAALRAMREKYGDRVYGKYGFVDAFNPNTGWVDTDVIGINAGIILLSAENSRTGNVWNWFMRNREIPRAMQLAGLARYQKKQSELRIRKAAHRRSYPQITQIPQIQSYFLRNQRNLRITSSGQSGHEFARLEETTSAGAEKSDTPRHRALTPAGPPFASWPTAPVPARRAA